MRIDASVLGEGFIQHRSEPTYLPTSTGKPAVFLNEVWRLDQSDWFSIHMLYGYFPEPEELKEAWNALRRASGAPGVLPEDMDFGDVARGRYPAYLRCIKDHAVVEISFAGSSHTPSPEESAVLFDKVKDAVFEKIEAQNFPPLAPFEANFEVLSSNPEVIVEIDIAPSPFRADYMYYVRPKDSYDDTVMKDWSIFEAAHSPITISGLPEGEYNFTVAVADDLGRRKKLKFDFTIGSSAPEPTQTLPTTRDTTLLIRKPHQNEGANPRLHLKKVQGKPAQVVVGFDTAGIDTNGLTKASLVLNIDSTQNVTGWGNGRPIRAQRLLTAWAEGNGKTLDLPNSQKTAGSGSGATWFSPVDSNISNTFADSTVNWNGGTTYAAPSTAPTVSIKNHQSGEVVFDVTQDLINGAEHGWLITRDQDVGSQVTFLSKEGGSSDLAPRLVLEYGVSVANLNTHSKGLLSTLGLRKAAGLAKNPSGSELKSAREVLQDSPFVAMLAEQALTEITRSNPAFSVVSRVAYRSWLAQGPRLARLDRRLDA